MSSQRDPKHRLLSFIERMRASESTNRTQGSHTRISISSLQSIVDLMPDDFIQTNERDFKFLARLGMRGIEGDVRLGIFMNSNPILNISSTDPGWAKTYIMPMLGQLKSDVMPKAIESFLSSNFIKQLAKVRPTQYSQLLAFATTLVDDATSEKLAQAIPVEDGKVYAVLPAPRFCLPPIVFHQQSDMSKAVRPVNATLKELFSAETCMRLGTIFTDAARALPPSSHQASALLWDAARTVTPR